eukprot:2117220-Amphidinium_carterae.1
MGQQSRRSGADPCTTVGHKQIEAGQQQTTLRFERVESETLVDHKRDIGRSVARRSVARQSDERATKVPRHQPQTFPAEQPLLHAKWTGQLCMMGA